MGGYVGVRFVYPDLHPTPDLWRDCAYRSQPYWSSMERSGIEEGWFPRVSLRYARVTGLQTKKNRLSAVLL